MGRGHVHVVWVCVIWNIVHCNGPRPKVRRDILRCHVTNTTPTVKINSTKYTRNAVHYDHMSSSIRAPRVPYMSKYNF